MVTCQGVCDSAPLARRLAGASAMTSRRPPHWSSLEQVQSTAPARRPDCGQGPRTLRPPNQRGDAAASAAASYGELSLAGRVPAHSPPTCKTKAPIALPGDVHTALLAASEIPIRISAPTSSAVMWVNHTAWTMERHVHGDGGRHRRLPDADARERRHASPRCSSTARRSPRRRTSSSATTSTSPAR